MSDSVRTGRRSAEERPTFDRAGGEAPLVSVIVPVKNGLPHFRRVLEALAGQKLDRPFEVIVIDSGSTDGSLELARSYELARAQDVRFRLVEIPASEFGHGRTRNYGVSLSRAPFCAFLTHDAVPLDDGWLHEIVRPLRDDRRVAGVFGRHVAYPDADPFTRDELDDHFRNLAAFPVVRLNDARAYVADEGLRKIYHFYSDNASCLRRSVWEAIPYPDIDFAEDQIWAKLVIEAGWSKAYAQRAVVYHSHDYSAWERLRRSYDEARALNELFGYRFIESPWQGLKTWGFLTQRDMRRAVRARWWWRHPASLLARPLQNAAKVTGHYLGTTNPAFVRRREALVSRDRALRALRKPGSGTAVAFHELRFALCNPGPKASASASRAGSGS